MDTYLSIPNVKQIDQALIAIKLFELIKCADPLLAKALTQVVGTDDLNATDKINTIKRVLEPFTKHPIPKPLPAKHKPYSAEVFDSESLGKVESMEGVSLKPAAQSVYKSYPDFPVTTIEGNDDKLINK